MTSPVFQSPQLIQPDTVPCDHRPLSERSSQRAAVSTSLEVLAVAVLALGFVLVSESELLLYGLLATGGLGWLTWMSLKIIELIRLVSVNAVVAAGVEQRIGLHLTSQDVRLEKVSSKVDALDQRVDGIERTIERLEG